VASQAFGDAAVRDRARLRAIELGRDAQLAARGVPHGQGDVLFGGQIGGGAEIRITPRLSIGADFRHNFVEGSNSGFSTFAFNQGLHW